MAPKMQHGGFDEDEERRECIEGELIEPEKISIGRLLELFRRLTLKTVLVLLAAVAAYTSAVFTMGCLVIMKDSGINLNLPFDMRLSVSEKDMATNGNTGMNYTLRNLVLVKHPVASTGDKKCYVIFRHFEPLDDRKVGQVECAVGSTSMRDAIRDRLFGGVQLFLGRNAYAQQISLGVHESDNNYRQSFVAPDTIQRTYADGCVLQFKIDANGNSIPSSYVWIVYRH